jgi:CarboxypepD_reg-like domain
MHFDNKGTRMLNLFSLRFPIFMRKLGIIIVFIGYFSAAHCQTFKGTVYDRLTDSTLSSAIIYISGTSIGIYSDIHGNFNLNISKYSSLPITISMLGYYSVTLSEHISNKMYDIYLSPKINELNEVVIKGKKGKWETYLRIFKREFLGETENAMECNILNEKDLRFSYNSSSFGYNSDSSTLIAFSSKPILIQNNSLGYTITYYLDKFKYSRIKGENKEITETSTIMGNYIFKDDLLTINEPGRSKVVERRKSAYLGSRMHFFRLLYGGNLHQRPTKYIISLSDNNLFSKTFSIGSKTPINADSLVIRKDKISSYIRKEGDLYIKFGEKRSTIVVKMDSAYFEKDGYYDPNAIEFSGEMSKQRIGDLLPFEYVLK